MLNSQSFIINCTKLFYDMKGYLCYKFLVTISTINWYGIIASFLNVYFCFFNLYFILNKFFQYGKIKTHVKSCIYSICASVYIDVCVCMYIKYFSTQNIWAEHGMILVFIYLVGILVMPCSTLRQKSEKQRWFRSWVGIREKWCGKLQLQNGYS